MESDPIRVRQIRTAAIAFYDSEPGRRGVAEATYHRLALGQTVDPAILRDPEIRASIQTAIVEFSIATQLELSALGFEVTDEVRSQASREQRDSSVASQVEDMLPYGATSVADAQRLVDDASQGMTTGPNPLYRAGARVAMQQGDLPRARTWISRGLEEAALANGGESTLGLVREQAWLDHGLTTSEDDVSLQQLATYAERYQDRMAMAQHRLQALAPKDAPPDAVLSALSTILRDLLRGLGPEGVWNLAPATLPRGRGVPGAAGRRDRRHRPRPRALGIEPVPIRLVPRRRPRRPPSRRCSAATRIRPGSRPRGCGSWRYGRIASSTSVRRWAGRRSN